MERWYTGEIKSLSRHESWVDDSIDFYPWKLVRNRVKALGRMRNLHAWTDPAFPALSCWIKGSITRMVVPVLSVRMRSNHRTAVFTCASCFASGPATVGHLQSCISLWSIFELWLWQKAWLLMGVMMRCPGTGLGWHPERTVGSSRHHLWLRQHIQRSAPPPQKGRRQTRPKVNVTGEHLETSNSLISKLLFFFFTQPAVPSPNSLYQNTESHQMTLDKTFLCGKKLKMHAGYLFVIIPEHLQPYHFNYLYL